MIPESDIVTSRQALVRRYHLLQADNAKCDVGSDVALDIILHATDVRRFTVPESGPGSGSESDLDLFLDHSLDLDVDFDLDSWIWT
jgi:hypothetical protein